ncbi:MAG: DUF4129 domain-containing protein [Acidimicrobiales bacterium]|nr:MAG: DUF4129 domain-containing protein [Acidimicrobiales bacterium]
MAWLRSRAEWFDARRRTIAAVLAGWLALMVVSAGRGADDTEWVTIPDLSWLLAAALGLSALAGLITLIVVRPRMKKALGERKRFRIRNLIVTLLILAALALILDGREVLENTTEEGPTEQPELSNLDLPENTIARTATDGGDIATLILLATLATAVLAWSHRRTTAPLSATTEPLEHIEPELASAIDDATRYLLHGSDPREAVMAAYATLEQALAAQNQGRSPAETPTEHMARVLRGVPTLAKPAVQLGRLYELARFSETNITANDKDEAARALDHARRELSALASDSA